MTRQKLGFDRLESRRLLAVDAVDSECLLESATRIDVPVPNDAVVQCRGEGTRSVLWQVPPGETSSPTGLGECRGGASYESRVNTPRGWTVTYYYETSSSNDPAFRWSLGYELIEEIENPPMSSSPDNRFENVPTVMIKDSSEETAPSNVSVIDSDEHPIPAADDESSANALAAGAILLTVKDYSKEPMSAKPDANDVAQLGEQPDEMRVLVEELQIYEVHEERTPLVDDALIGEADLETIAVDEELISDASSWEDVASGTEASSVTTS